MDTPLLSQSSPARQNQERKKNNCIKLIFILFSLCAVSGLMIGEYFILADYQDTLNSGRDGQILSGSVLNPYNENCIMTTCIYPYETNKCTSIKLGTAYYSSCEDKLSISYEQTCGKVYLSNCEVVDQLALDNKFTVVICLTCIFIALIIFILLVIFIMVCDICRM